MNSTMASNSGPFGLSIRDKEIDINCFSPFQWVTLETPIEKEKNNTYIQRCMHFKLVNVHKYAHSGIVTVKIYRRYLIIYTCYSGSVGGKEVPLEFALNFACAIQGAEV